MIKDKTLIKVSLAVSLIGMAMLFAAVKFMEPLSMEIGKIDETTIGRNVVVAGTVQSISIKEGNVFVTLADNADTINIVMFRQAAKKNATVYDTKKGSVVAVKGKVDIYNGGLEIIASEISASP